MVDGIDACRQLRADSTTTISSLDLLRLIDRVGGQPS
jgi:hypothetical protein